MAESETRAIKGIIGENLYNRLERDGYEPEQFLSWYHDMDFSPEEFRAKLEEAMEHGFTGEIKKLEQQHREAVRQIHTLRKSVIHDLMIKDADEIDIDKEDFAEPDNQISEEIP